MRFHVPCLHPQVMSIAFGFVHNKSQAMAVRFLLGVFEAGMLPGIAYFLSRWYRKAELTFRLALYVVTAPLVSIPSSGAATSEDLF